MKKRTLSLFSDILEPKADSQQVQGILSKLDMVSKLAVNGLVEDGAIVLYSGGIDSSILASLVGGNQRSSDCRLFAAGIMGSKDIAEITSARTRAILNQRLPLMISEIARNKVLGAA